MYHPWDPERRIGNCCLHGLRSNVAHGRVMMITIMCSRLRRDQGDHDYTRYGRDIRAPRAFLSLQNLLVHTSVLVPQFQLR